MGCRDELKGRTKVILSALLVAAMASACGQFGSGSDWEQNALEDLQRYFDPAPRQVALDELISNADASLPPQFTANTVCVSFETYWTDEAAECALNADELDLTVWEGEANNLYFHISSEITSSDVRDMRMGRNPTPLDALSYGGVSPEVWLLEANEDWLYQSTLQIYYPGKGALIEISVAPEMGPIKDDSANVYENAIWLSDTIGFTYSY